mmetsp:Transcript_11847/g.25021  ORF Transcript_11847/g.25021 Transcript_11847/m.25021 type:complete len:188 (-) Transcript_11847:406-969(-)
MADLNPFVSFASYHMEDFSCGWISEREMVSATWGGDDEKVTEEERFGFGRVMSATFESMWALDGMFLAADLAWARLRNNPLRLDFDGDKDPMENIGKLLQLPSADAAIGDCACACSNCLADGALGTAGDRIASSCVLLAKRFGEYESSGVMTAGAGRAGAAEADGTVTRDDDNDLVRLPNSLPNFPS